VQQAMDFFQRANYPRNVASCLTQIGRGQRRKGDYVAALQTLNQKLDSAKQSNSQPAIADAYLELGALYFDEGKWPLALEQYDNALKIYESIDSKLRIEFCKANRGNILWHLGHYPEAQQVLAEVTAKITAEKGNFLQLLPEITLVSAEMRLSEGNLPAAITLAMQAGEMAGTKLPDVAIKSKYVLGLAKTLSGEQKDGQRLLDESVNAASSTGDVALYIRTLLVAAEAALARKDAQKALALATQAQERSAGGGQLESQWRAWNIIARANSELGNKDQSVEQTKRSSDALGQLQQQWGADAFKRYTSRPDIQVYMRGAGQ
jgi:tetratricopeptide (TPR) repeat protein